MPGLTGRGAPASSSGAQMATRQAGRRLLTRLWHTDCGLEHSVFHRNVSAFSSLPDANCTSTSASVSTNSQASSGPVRHTYATKGYGSHPPPKYGEVPLWTSDVIPSTPKIPVQRQIFCNRALNMKQIRAVGFDMDYTLAQYKPETFEGLAHKETVQKLVEFFNYPSQLFELDFKWDYMTKGLIIDRERGNMLKVDRHNYVKVAYHGFKLLGPDERKRIYNQSHVSGSFDEKGFAMVDTLFSLAEAYLYMQLVELKDKGEHAVLVRKSYTDLYRDLRTAVDMCHRDGSLKRAVAANPELFIHQDDHLKQVLTSLRDSGRKVFLATNSLWDYTNVVMNFLLLGKTGAHKSTEWLEYFDVVLVGCAKPSFFVHRAPLFSVNLKSGHLENTDNGAPIIPIDEQDMQQEVGGSSAVEVTSNPSGRNGWHSTGHAGVFQGGWYMDLHKMLGVHSGSEVMYIGDHIYGDIVKSKKDIGWRTMLVVPELELELENWERSHAMQSELRQLRSMRDLVDDRIQRLRWSLDAGQAVAEDSGASSDQEDTKTLQLLDIAERERTAIKQRHSELLRQHHARFHPIWGQLMKTGHQNSRFAHQVERYACLYTSHVGNLAFVSPNKSFMGRLDFMAHEYQEL